MSEESAKAEVGLAAALIPVTPFQQNCSLLWCRETRKAAVIDPGGDLDQILAAVQHYDLDLERIFVTHGHLDHCGGAAVLAERLNVPIEGPEESDSFWIERLAEDSGRFGITGRPFVPDRWLKDGDTVEIGGTLRFDVIHCPGHTPGHVVFYHRPARLAVVGDVLFKGSIGRTDFPRGDHAALIHSIRDKLFPLGDDITFVPGHGELSTFGAERRTNPFVSDYALGLGGQRP